LHADTHGVTNANTDLDSHTNIHGNPGADEYTNQDKHSNADTCELYQRLGGVGFKGSTLSNAGEN